jgi:TolB-like protein/DNA-binding winged helix-turn-helix (wHTH) protein/Tfp pilus assembly protein PilF
LPTALRAKQFQARRTKKLQCGYAAGSQPGQNMESIRTVVFRFANAEFEQLSGTLRVAGQERRLRPQSAAVLAQLLSHVGQLVSQEQLLQSVWGDTIVTDNSLAQCISEIRAALGPANDKLIETVPRRGYILRSELKPDNTPTNPPIDKPADVHPKGWMQLGAAALVIILGAALWLGLRLLPQANAARLSLAVLPFQSHSLGPEQAWFADTVGEDLSLHLSRIPGAQVIARVSTQAYGAGSTDVRQVGRELGVRHVVGGSVARDGDQVSMNLYLADTDSGAIEWTERFDTQIKELHGAQRQVAERIANALHVRLVAVEARRLENQSPGHATADDLALQAWAAWNRGTAADVARAKELAQQALALDPRSVLAWKTMASWHLRARINQSIPAEQAVAGAEDAARHAMTLDPDHPLVHTVYGGALTLRGRFEEAQAALEHEIASNPSHPVAYYYLGLAQLMMGHSQQAIALYQRAISISPRDPRLSRFHRYLALAYLHDNDLPSALKHARSATQVPIVDRSAWAMLAAVCALSGDPACSQAANARLHQIWPDCTLEKLESEWPPARAQFSQQHESYLRGLRLAGL